MLRFVFAFLFISIFGAANIHVYSQNNEEIAQTVVHLLNYVSMDYAGSVQNGEVIDEQEYEEQKEFAQRAFDLTNSGSFINGKAKSDVKNKLMTLIKAVNDKAPTETINQLISQIIKDVVEESGIQTAPKVWPNFENGKQLFIQNCAMCHGKEGKGDGIAGKSLEPKPTNFLDDELMSNLSPYQAFNSIRLGVPETGMQAYSHFSVEEVWDLAFYIKSMRFNNSLDSIQSRTLFNQIALKIGLDNIANMSDNHLQEELKSLKIDDENALAILRTVSPIYSEAENSLPIAKKNLLEALKSYQKGDRKLALTQAISAYLEGVEPVEARLKTINSKFVSELETQMFNVRTAIEKDKGEDVLKAEIDKALDLIHEANQLMSNQKMNFLLTFLISLSIVLREALEAFLIIAIVLSLIKATGNKKALIWLHGGWLSAVALGILGWFLSDYIIQFGGRNREIMEGLVSLFAVVVLLIMGFWMHNQTHAAQWTKFVKERIGGLLNSERMFGLAAFSFMVVFREAFEVILFLQAVNLEAAGANKSAIGLGVVAAGVAILIIAYLFLKYSKKLPIRELFKYSTWLLAVLSVILTGKGIHSLQESGWVSVTNLSFIPRIDWLGVYPSLQTILSQFVLVIIIIVVIKLNDMRHSQSK